MEAFVLLFIFLVGAFVIISFIKIISNQIGEKRKNDDAPVLDIPVVVVEKRVQTITRSNSHDSFSTRNDFKIIFEHLHNGNRHTFSMDESEFDQIIEDDIGYLTFQRKRYHGFVRDFTAGNSPSYKNTNPQNTIEDVPLKIE